MKKDFAIRIFHNTTNKIEFLFWAELFRLCGIFVGEGLLSDRVGEELAEKKKRQDADDSCFQVFLAIGSREAVRSYEDRLPWSDLLFTDDIFSVRLQGSEAIKWPEQSQEQEKQLENVCRLIDDLFNAVSEKGWLLDEIGFWDDIKTLAKIYLKHSLLLYSMNLQFYHYNTKLLDQIETNYYNAYREIAEMRGVTPTITYALLFCGYKANDAAQLKGNPARVEQGYLMDQCRELCEKYPEFINAKVLLGLIFSSSKGNAAEAIDAFRNATGQLKEACFCSHIYYWIGNRWEQVSGQGDEAEKNYLLAYQRKPKYRNIYKLGVFAENRKDFKLACKRYRELLERLQIRINRDFADPLELHYYIKTCCRLGDLYGQQEKMYEQAVAAYEKGRAAYEGSYCAARDGRDFFVHFYGDEWEKYREVTDDTVRIDVIYRKAMDAYGILKNREKIQEYRDLLRKGESPIIF